MRDWFHWVDKKQELLQAGLQGVVDTVEKGAAPRQAINAFLKGIYHRLISVAIDENPQLRMFDGMKFRKQVEQYKHDTREFQELSKQELFCKLASRIPATSADNPEISFLKRNIANGGRGNSIRTILDGIPTLFPKLCPCMLMSPISVAQYIDLDAEKFDLVMMTAPDPLDALSPSMISKGKSQVRLFC